MSKDPVNLDKRVEPCTGAKKVPAKRRVCFCNEIEAWPREDPTLDAYEVQARWLQDTEVRASRKHLNRTLSLLRAGANVNESNYCSRGVEYLVDVEANKTARRLVVHSVLIEQDLQRYEGINDVERMAKASREFSSDHKEWAYRRGLEDQLERFNGKSFTPVRSQENKLMHLKRMSAMSSFWNRAQ